VALLSTKGMYGLSAMYEIYLKGGTTPMQTQEIAKNANIPQNYLEQILVVLKKAELVKSKRGAKGGYLLTKNAKDIHVKDIFIALEKEIKVTTTEVKQDVLNLFYENSDKKLLKIFDISLFDIHKKYNKNRKQNINYTTFGL